MEAPIQAEGIASQFVSARRRGTGLSDYPGPIPATLDEGYAVQKAAIRLFDAPIAGWKVGRIMPPLSEQMGADRLSGPIFGPSVQMVNGSRDNLGLIFADGFGAAESEYLIRIGTAPVSGKSDYSLAEAAELIGAIHIGIEIASSPFAGINSHGPAVTVSDFGNNNGIIIGPAIDGWRESGLGELEVMTRIDGKVVGSGRANAFPDGIIGSTRFLLNNLAERGIGVEPGCWISSGAVTGVHKVAMGQSVEADFGRFGMVACTIGKQPASK